MKRKKWALLLSTLLLTILIAIFVAWRNNLPSTSGTKNNDPTSNNNPTSNKPPGQVLVTPETPLGMIGPITAIAAGVAIFTLAKRKK